LTSALEAESEGVLKPVKAHRLVAKKLKNSSQFSNNILKTKTKILILKNKKDKARKAKGRGISIRKRKIGKKRKDSELSIGRRQQGRKTCCQEFNEAHRCCK
jgi:hypothetical protein